MKTFENTIVNEVREIRRHYAERHGYDLDKIVAALQRRNQMRPISCNLSLLIRPQQMSKKNVNARDTQTGR